MSTTDHRQAWLEALGRDTAPDGPTARAVEHELGVAHDCLFDLAQDGRGDSVDRACESLAAAIETLTALRGRVDAFRTTEYAAALEELAAVK